MSKYIRFLPYILLAVLFFGFLWLVTPKNGEGGTDAQTKQVAPAIPQGAPRLVVALMDSTGSFHYFEQSKAKLRRFAQSLRPQDLLYVVVITPEATSADLRVRPDPGMLELLKRADAKRTYRPEVKAYTADFVTQVDKLQYTGRRGTDIYGAIYRASQIFSGECDHPVRYLLVFSDLGDTTARENLIGQIYLDNVMVRCFYFPDTLIQEEDKTLKPNPERWSRQFTDWGARSVTILDDIQSDRESPIP